MNRIVLLAVAIALVATIAPAQSPTVRVTGMYSDMRYIPQAGDVLGTEVFIVANGNGYSAVVQIAEGVPNVPIVVPARVNGSDVSFSLPDIKFEGHVTATALVGTLGRERLSLRRGKSYWQ